jgi:hypothetical protein
MRAAKIGFEGIEVAAKLAGNAAKLYIYIF